MSSSLPDTNLVPDKTNNREIEEFLNNAYILARSNPSTYITGDMIYSLLKDYHLKQNEVDQYGRGIDTRYMFERWENNFKNRKTKAFCDEVNFKYWFQFINDMRVPYKGERVEYIKLYIPIDYNHLEEGVNELFSFLERERIPHLSKVGSKMRVDNVIVRLRKGDVTSAKKVIDFVGSNLYLRNGLNSCNPFIPTRNGVGFMNEHGNSYNTDIANIISSYINKCIRINRKPNIEEFREFVTQNTEDKDLVETFNKCSSIERKRVPQRIDSIEKKTSLLMDALKATYLKYGIEQIKIALTNIIKYGYYNNITNGTNIMRLRDNLSENVSPKDVYNIVSNSLKSLTNGGISLDRGLDSGISVYCILLFSNDLSFIIDEIASVTLENHGPEQVVYALNKFYRTGNVDSFSSFSKESKDINYRRKMAMLFNRDNLMNAIKISLQNKGVMVNDTRPENLIDCYVDNLIKGHYNKMSERPKMIA